MLEGLHVENKKQICFWYFFLHKTSKKLIFCLSFLFQPCLANFPDNYKNIIVKINLTNGFWNISNLSTKKLKQNWFLFNLITDDLGIVRKQVTI